MAISAAIVLTAFVVAGVYWNREQLAIKIKSVFVRVPPKAVQAPPGSKRHGGAFVAQAGWVLSTLPECFRQIQLVAGPSTFVLKHVPAGMTMLRPGASIDAADCVLTVGRDTVVVRRGTDQLRVPPVARLYRSPGHIALLRTAGRGYQLRVYATSTSPEGR